LKVLIAKVKSCKNSPVRLRIMRDFEHNNEHNDTMFEEIWNRIMMKIWSIIPSSLISPQN